MKSLPLEVNSNKILLAFSKVAWCKLYWVNQYGQTADTKPEFPTYYKERVDGKDRPAFSVRTHDTETYEDYLKRHQALDVWAARLCFQLTANHSMYYTGAMAVRIERAYRGWLLSKQQQRNKRKSNKPCNQQKELL